MNRTRTRLIAAALAAALALVPVGSAFARGGFRGGGFRSGSSLRSLGSPRSFSGWGSATKPTLKASPSGSASTPRLGGISGSRSGVSAQRGLYDSARRNGSLFSSKAEASQAFKSRYAKDYATTFAAEPSVRPSYIPASALVGGRNVDIAYNPALGGYGYLHPALGTWILFDALSDAATLDFAMSRHGYYWGGAPAYVSHGPSFLGLAFAVLAVLLVLALIARAAGRAAQRREGPQ
jgi:hypothetical protein